jgi:hypothetical protein
MQGPATRLQAEEYKGTALLKDKGWHSTIVRISFGHQTKKEQRWLT